MSYSNAKILFLLLLLSHFLQWSRIRAALTTYPSSSCHSSLLQDRNMFRFQFNNDKYNSFKQQSEYGHFEQYAFQKHVINAKIEHIEQYRDSCAIQTFILQESFI